MAELTITRSALKRIAKKAMTNSGISREERAKLTEVAETADEILLHGWRRRKYGCLVGTAHPEFFTARGKWRARYDRDHSLNALGDVGSNFDFALHDYLGEPQGPAQLVKVIG